MRKLSLCVVLFFSVLMTLGCQERTRRPLALYISPQGNDAWSGRRPSANAAPSDGPFATLARAREEIRALRRAGQFPAHGVRVFLRGGDYALASTFELTAEDSGSVAGRVVWASYPGETARLVGGRPLSGWRKVDDGRVLARLNPEARSHVLAVDLHALAISEVGRRQRSGMGLPEVPAPLELFFRGQRMTVARYPNEGWLRIVEVPQHGPRLLYEGVAHTPKDGLPRGRHYGRFVYPGDRPAHWQPQEVWMHGFWSWDWADAYLPVGRIDTARHEIYPAEPHHHYGYTKEQPFYFLNVLEELDAPGEYYVEPDKGMLYFWPPEEVRPGDLWVSELAEDMVRLSTTAFVSLEGLVFEFTRGNAVRITGGHDNVLAGCVVRNIGNSGVTVSGGVRNGVQSCDIHDTGDGGIRLIGGDRLSLLPASHFALNNHIYRISRINLTYRDAIRVEGVGNHVAHNLVHDAPHEAIYFNGNEHVIEYNEIYDVVKETGDAGAIYGGRDYTWRGTVVRYNFIHDLHGPGLFGVMGVYLDDFMSGTAVVGNVFYRAGRAVFLGGGRDNLVENNVFVDCQASVHIDARGLTWARNYFDGGYTWLTDRMRDVNYDQPPFSTRYPELLGYYADNPAVPRGNKVLRNVSAGGTWLDIEDGVDPGLLEMRDNVIADPVLCYWRGPEVKDAPTGTVYKNDDPQFREELAGNAILEGDPGFVAKERGDFRLRKGSVALQRGFVNPPIEEIGLYRDRFRRHLPEKGR
ncbi:MAG: right-handed parallel beta-helix repeat-containing protein [bacterium]|nr:right-handed parallel beta-helix repeat-containing protein [candidate division KSB1 bacterium]MDH7560494.1 right-handed parallel beta-helix repeat-containing protein [bacterium]